MRLVLWPRIWSVMVNVLHALQKNRHSAVVEYKKCQLGQVS